MCLCYLVQRANSLVFLFVSVLLIGSYVAFFTVLIAMFIVFMALFYWIVDWNYPTIQGPSSILQTPGIGFRPQPNIHSTVIRFVKGDGATYVHHLDHIEAYLKCVLST